MLIKTFGHAQLPAPLNSAFGAFMTHGVRTEQQDLGLVAMVQDITPDKIRGIFADIHTEAAEKFNQPDTQKSAGTTASMLVVKPNSDVITANLGDSGSFLIVHNTSTHNVLCVPVTKRHKPFDPQEAERIKALGGEIIDRGRESVYATVDNSDGISTTGGFGDYELEKILRREPDIREIHLDDEIADIAPEEEIFAVTVSDDIYGSPERIEWLQKFLGRSFKPAATEGQPINPADVALHVHEANQTLKMRETAELAASIAATLAIEAYKNPNNSILGNISLENIMDALSEALDLGDDQPTDVKDLEEENLTEEEKDKRKEDKIIKDAIDEATYQGEREAKKSIFKDNAIVLVSRAKCAKGHEETFEHDRVQIGFDAHADDGEEFVSLVGELFDKKLQELALST